MASSHRANERVPPSSLQQAGVTAGALQRPGLTLREAATPTLVRLHSLEASEHLAASLAGEGIELPLDTNGAAGEDPAALCLRPGEWLLLGGQRAAGDLIAGLRPRLDPSLTTVLDLSDGLGLFSLSGAGSPWLLAKLSGLDFLAGARTGQHSARTRLGETGVVLHFRPAPDGTPCFDVIFDRSIAKYLWDLLNDAAPHAEELLDLHGAAT